MKLSFHTPSPLRALAPSLLAPSLIAATLLVAALAAPAAQAQTVDAPAIDAAGHGHRGAGRGMAWLKAVGATPAQQASIKAIFMQARTQAKALRAAAGDPRRQLAAVLAAPTVDATAAATAQQAIDALHSSVGSVMLQAKLQIAAVLTPAQRAQLYAAKQASRRG